MTNLITHADAYKHMPLLDMALATSRKYVMLWASGDPAVKMISSEPDEWQYWLVLKDSVLPGGGGAHL